MLVENSKSQKPWLLESNERYREVIRTLISLSTAAMAVPIFFLVNFSKTREFTSLLDLLTWRAYCSWAFLGISIISGLIFFYTSASWVWVSYGRKPWFWGKYTDDKNMVLSFLNTSFWICVLGFLLGIFFQHQQTTDNINKIVTLV